MFEHEINGMDADKDEPCSLDHTLFNKDFFEEPAPRKKPVLKHGATTDIPSHTSLKVPITLAPAQ